MDDPFAQIKERMKEKEKGSRGEGRGVREGEAEGEAERREDTLFVLGMFCERVVLQVEGAQVCEGRQLGLQVLPAFHLIVIELYTRFSFSSPSLFLLFTLLLPIPFWVARFLSHQLFTYPELIQAAQSSDILQLGNLIG